MVMYMENCQGMNMKDTSDVEYIDNTVSQTNIFYYGSPEEGIHAIHISHLTNEKYNMFVNNINFDLLAKLQSPSD